MAVLSNHLKNKLTDWLLRGQAFTPPPTVYVALYTAMPTAAGGGTEVSGGSYARVAVASSMTNWSGTQGAATTVASSGTGPTSNNGNVTWPAPTAAWGGIVGYALLDAATGGNLLIFGQLADPKTVNAGDSAPAFFPGALEINFDGSV